MRFSGGPGKTSGSSIVDRMPLLFLVAVVGLFVAVGAPAYVLLSDATERRYVEGYSEAWARTAPPLFERHLDRIPSFPLSGPLTGDRRDKLTDDIRANFGGGELLDLKVWSAGGTLLYSLNGDRTGTTHPPSRGFAEALAGTTFVEVGAEEASEATGRPTDMWVFEAYVPLAGPDGGIANVVELLYPADALAGVNGGLIKLLVILFVGVVGVGQFGYYLLSRRKRQFETLTLHDQLTGFPNRRAFLAHLEPEAARRAQDRPLAVILFNVDGQRRTNDRYGHSAGDQALRQVGARLATGAPGIPVARLDGDEFAVLSRVTDEAEASSLASQMLATLESRLHFPPIVVTARGGIAVARTPVSTSTLLRRADVALEYAKRSGGGTAVVANKQMEEEWERRQQLVAELAEAVSKSELVLEYQPIVELDTGSVVGMEALVRWHHPQLGVVPPGEFIGLAEETGAIAPIDRWVRQTALRQTRLWMERYPNLDEFQIRVNVSALEFEQPGLAAEITRILRTQRLNPARLEIEVTETAVMSDPDRAISQLRELAGTGIHVAIDDFGTGYSSLAYLRALPANTLKVDRSFVNGIEDDRMAQSLVTSLVQLGRQFGFEVLAEGIETPEQHALLLRLGCRLGQGYLFGRPMPPEAAEELLGGNREHAA